MLSLFFTYGLSVVLGGFRVSMTDRKTRRALRPRLPAASRTSVCLFASGTENSSALKRLTRCECELLYSFFGFFFPAARAPHYFWLIVTHS